MQRRRNTQRTTGRAKLCRSICDDAGVSVEWPLGRLQEVQWRESERNGGAAYTISSVYTPRGSGRVMSVKSAINATIPALIGGRER